MKFTLAVILAFLALTRAIPGAHAFSGPLEVRNHYPLFLHAGQPFLEKASLENSFSLAFSYSSTYTVRSSADWDIGMDLEMAELLIRYKRIIADLLELNIDVPLLIFGSGFLDGFLEDYHDTFGFSDYGRSQRPKDEFLYDVRRSGDIVVEGKTGTRLGDIRLGVKKPLHRAEGFALTLRADLEIPVSSAKRGYSNGSVDVGASLLLEKALGERIMAYGNVGVVLPGDLRAHERIDLKTFVHGGVALEALLGKGFSAVVQFSGQSRLFPETGVSAVDDAALMLAFGGRYDSGSNSFELSLTEDVNTAGVPDFIVNLSYKRLL